MTTVHDIIFCAKKKIGEKGVGVVAFDLIGLLPTNHVKYLKKFHCQKVDSTRNGKPRRLSGRFQNLIWRLGETIQNLESPRLSGRVDSPAAQCS